MILVTGGFGLVGSNLAKWMKQELEKKEVQHAKIN
ncbi:nucleoside-diphosphate-sugar epimerase [Ammoniphilus resinae]|uniref:Nucleoside-diphosphate-sugar epimerase n=1 Tax=Ammoniphilus resinae TaxID=861532 RepID=A0ABS4GL84_9BACL|nr:nucleoside-diphosphate-sugar epimerase [Ammoniphilus resinae]